MLPQHSTSDPPAFLEEVKLQLIVHRQKGCLPRASSPFRHSNIDGCEKKGDGFSIIYDYKEDADFFLFFLLLLSLLRFHVRNPVSLAALEMWRYR